MNLDTILHNKVATALVAVLGTGVALLVYLYGPPDVKTQASGLVVATVVALTTIMRGLAHSDSSEGKSDSEVKKAVVTVTTDVVAQAVDKALGNDEKKS